MLQAAERRKNAARGEAVGGEPKRTKAPEGVKEKLPDLQHSLPVVFSILQKLVSFHRAL